MHDLYTTHVVYTKRNSIENQFEHSHAELLRVGITRKHESAMLEPLCEQTEPRAIPEEELEQIPPAIEEHIQTPRQRILAEPALHQTHQTIEGATHVDRVPVRQDPAGLAIEKHPHPPIRAVVPSGKMMSIVQRPPGSGTTGSDAAATAAGLSSTNSDSRVGWAELDRRSFQRQNCSVFGETPACRQNVANGIPLRPNRSTIARHSDSLRRRGTRCFAVIFASKEKEKPTHVGLIPTALWRPALRAAN
jgi:hypothetical protein